MNESEQLGIGNQRHTVEYQFMLNTHSMYLQTCNSNPEHFGPHLVHGEPTSTRGVPKFYLEKRYELI